MNNDVRDGIYWGALCEECAGALAAEAVHPRYTPDLRDMVPSTRAHWVDYLKPALRALTSASTIFWLPDAP